MHLLFMNSIIVRYWSSLTNIQMLRNFESGNIQNLCEYFLNTLNFRIQTQIWCNYDNETFLVRSYFNCPSHLHCWIDKWHHALSVCAWKHPLMSHEWLTNDHYDHKIFDRWRTIKAWNDEKAEYEKVPTSTHANLKEFCRISKFTSEITLWNYWRKPEWVAISENIS